MKIDIHTLAFVLSIIHILQVLALLVLYRLKLSFDGIGFWTTGTGLCALGFACNYLRDFPGIGTFAIIINNTFFVAGLLFIYVGVLRFFGRNGRLSLYVAICVAVTVAAFYFTLIDDNPTVRRIVISLAVGGIWLMIARALFTYRNRSVAASAHFLCAVFVTGGVIFLLRGLTPFLVLNPGNLFTTSLTQVLTYLTALVVSTLWTLGFIIMACQRSAFESREAHEHFELIFNTSPDAVLITRLKDGLIAEVNDAFVKQTGFSREDVIGTTTVASNIWKNLADRQSAVEHLREHGCFENFEFDYLRKDGGLMPGMTSAQVLELHGEPHFISVTRDITGRRENERKLLEAKNATETALKSEREMLQEQRQFLSMVSHEFRTPLAVIDSAATNLTAVPPEDQAELDKRAEQITRATRALAHLIDNCITSERVEYGGFTINLQETDVFTFIEEVAQTAGNHAKNTVTVDCSEAPIIWFFDQTLVKIALSNLIDNAIKYSDDGKAMVRALCNSNGLCIQVMNRGHGISSDEAEMMFRKFIRGNTAKNGRNVRGSGLGLFISQRIAQAHGGDVRLVPGEKGTTLFEIVIPGD